MILFSVLLLPFIWQAVGGLPGMRETIPLLAPDRDTFSLVVPGEIGLFYILVLTINNLAGIVVQPQNMGASAAGKTEIDGAVGFMFGSFIKRVCTMMWCLTGLAAVAYYGHSLEDPDVVYGQVARDFLPGISPGLLGLFLAGFPLMQRILWQGPWKMVFNGFDFDELYQLENDPHEMRNLARLAKHQPRLRQMMQAIWRRVEETGDRTLSESHYFSMRFAMVGPNVARG